MKTTRKAHDYAQAAKKPGGQPSHQNRFILFMIQHHFTKITKITKDAGLQEVYINQAFDYFDKKAAPHFNVPNFRNPTDMQPQLPRVRELREGSHQGYSMTEEDEEDDLDDYDTSHQSAGTTRATESITRKHMKGRGKTTEQRPRPGSIVTTSTKPRLRTSMQLLHQ
eukprot:326607-Amphidinium_carterae.4